MSRCKDTIYIITEQEDLVTRFTLAKLFYDEHNRGRMSGRVYLAKDIDSAIEHAVSNKLGWVFFIKPGQVFLADFWETFYDFIDDNPDIGMLAHIMPDHTLHTQCVAVDLSRRCAVGLAQCLLPDGPRGYPKEIISGPVPPNGSLSRLASCLLPAARVVNWPQLLRDQKVYFYPKHHSDLERRFHDDTTRHQEWHHAHLQTIDSVISAVRRHDKLIWIVNNKKPQEIEFDVPVIAPASGTWWLECRSPKITVIDTNPTQLKWAQDLWRAKPRDVLEFSQNWVESNPGCHPNYLHSARPDTEAVAALVGLACYDKEIEFRVADYYQDIDVENHVVWASNIFLYEPNLFQKGIVAGKDTMKKIRKKNYLIADGEIPHGWI